MTLRRLLISALCCLALASCAKLAPGGAGLNDPCLRTSDCLDPYVCENGHCQINAPTACTPGELRCNGNDLEVCRAGGEGYDVKESCERGCVGGACRPQACTPGNQRCQGDTVEECLPDGSGYAVQQTCPTSCQVDPEDMTKAACTAPVCNPFETQCDATDPTKLDTCNSNGTAFTVSACPLDATNQPTTCAFGRCLPVVCSVTRDAQNNVTSRQQRCNGVVAEQCDDSGTSWQATQVCQNGCNFDEATGKATCPASVCAPYSTQCADGTTLQTCNSTGTAWVSSMCTAPGGAQALCVNGACAPKLCNAVVTDTNGSFVSGDTQCSGDASGNSWVQYCDSTEIKWDNQKFCQFGCQKQGNAPAQCAPAACQVGQQRCNGNALEACTPDQAAFGFVQYCSSGCVSNTMTTPPTAACAPPACPPLNRQCVMDAQGHSSVEVCRADGTQYDPLEMCPEGCAGGVCVTTNDSCNPGDYRCQGDESQLCVLLSSGATQWRFNEHCFGQCSSGACTTTAACGCSGGADSTDICGPTGNVQPITLSAALPSATTTVPCSNTVSTSRILVTTGVIASAEGITVPDGTMVTFANDYPAGANPDNLIASADADPSAPGIQRPTLNGQAAMLITAPSCSDQRVVTITASAGGSCAGSTQVTFTSQPITGPQTVYVAEDFTSTLYEDRSLTTAQWNASIGASVAQPDYTLGTGKDLDIEVPQSTTLDLQAAGYAPAWNVTGITAQGALLDTSSPLTLVAGDEVLLITVWGPPNSTGPGTYEFKHVASVSGSTVNFDAPVAGLYGNGTNATLSNHRVVLQRVPQFNNVTVDTGATLTSAAPNKGTCTSNCVPTGGTGVLAFRARGTVLVHGTISMDGHGLPTGLTSLPNVAPTASLNKLLLGNPGSAGAGGGVIFIAGGTVSFAATPTGSPLCYHPDSMTCTSGYDSSGLSIHSGAATADGNAGTVWVEGGSLQFGSNDASRIVANVGGNGHTRIDYGWTDNSTTPMTSSGTTFTGQAGASYVQSTALYPRSADQVGSFAITSATLMGALGGSGLTIFGTPGSAQVIPGVNVLVSADGGATWGDVDIMGVAFDMNMSTPMTPKVGQNFKYRAALATTSDQPLDLRAVAFQLQLQ